MRSTGRVYGLTGLQSATKNAIKCVENEEFQALYLIHASSTVQDSGYEKSARQDFAGTGD